MSWSRRIRASWSPTAQAREALAWDDNVASLTEASTLDVRPDEPAGTKPITAPVMGFVPGAWG